MSDTVLELLNLFGRWIHVIAGILWIGQTWLFTWMERAFEAPQDKGDPNITGELWMVHGGGFYFVQKQKWPKLMPHTLHWFKWEAMMTWLTGVFLLHVVYWMGSPLLKYGTELSKGAGIAVSIGTLVLGWVGYVLIFRSPLGRNEAVGAAVGWLATVAVAWGLSQVFSNRAAYLHVGAMYGTIMVANVWMVIIPAQKKIMAITEAGGKPDPTLGAKGKKASKHNTFMGVPLIFTMISNHFPATTYGLEHGWLVLGGIVLLGWGMAWWMREKL